MQENCYKKNTRNVIYIYGLAKTFLKQPLKKTFKPNKKNPNMEENLR